MENESKTVKNPIIHKNILRPDGGGDGGGDDGGEGGKGKEKDNWRGEK
jgi:hypothetical protein